MSESGAGTTVMIADDHAVVRSGLRLLLDAEDGLEVVAATCPTRSAWSRHTVRRAVLDLNMPGSSSLDAIAELCNSTPATAIVVLTMQDDPAFARQALRNGALGFVLKEAADEELLEAVRLAARGKRYLNPRLGRPHGGIALGDTNAEIAGQLHCPCAPSRPIARTSSRSCGTRAGPSSCATPLEHRLVEA